MTIEQSILRLIFPNEIFEWFDAVSGTKDDHEVHVVFEEKNIPPPTNTHQHGNVVSKGFTDITISDFPIRGRKTLLTFRRRYWRIDGEPKLLKRDIKLVFPGTQLEQEFASFLKEGSGD